MFKYLSTARKSSLTMNLDLTKVLRFGDPHNHDDDPTKVQEKSFLHRISQEVEKFLHLTQRNIKPKYSKRVSKKLTQLRIIEMKKGKKNK